MSMRRLFEDLKGLRAPAGTDADARADYRALREVFVSFLPGNPGAIASLLRDPAVSAPLRCLRNGVGAPEGLIAEFVGQSLFRLASSGALRTEVTMKRPPARLLDAARGWHIATEGRELRFGPEGVFAGRERLEPKAGASVPIAEGMHLALFDNNPLRMNEAHPDKQGNALSLGGKDAADWITALQEALALIEAFLPELRREMEMMLRLVVPVGYDEERHLSASFQEALGVVYLSLHPDPMTMAEALVHEFSHNKLNALFELNPLLENAFSPLYPSPVRPDPRPLHGILLAVHAFLPIEELYRRLRDARHEHCRSPRFERRFESICEGNRDGAAVLFEHAKATAVGQGVLDEFRFLLEGAA